MSFEHPQIAVQMALCVATVAEKLGEALRFDVLQHPINLSALCEHCDGCFVLRCSWLDAYDDRIIHLPGRASTSWTFEDIVAWHDAMVQDYFTRVHNPVNERDGSGENFERARQWSEQFCKQFGVRDKCITLMGCPDEIQTPMKAIGKPIFVHGFKNKKVKGKQVLAFHVGVGVAVEQLNMNFGVVNHEFYFEECAAPSGSAEAEGAAGLPPKKKKRRGLVSVLRF